MISKKPFRVHLFKVRTGDNSMPLPDLLSAADAHTIEARVRKIGLQELRLEIAEPPVRARPYWLLDFCKLRYDGGPGKAGRETQVESIDLDEGEGFAEETAMLYDPTSDFAIVQYNHHGPRSGSIAEYLSIYDTDQVNDYGLLLQLNPDAQARLDHKKIFTRLEIKVAPAKLSKAFRKANVALCSALEQHQQHFGGDYVSVTVGLEQRSPASLKLAKWISAFKRLANDEDEAVTELRIDGRDSAGEALDPVDLIREKLEIRFSDLNMDAGLRYVREDRWKALQRAYNGWVKNGTIETP